jgi:hypothetical protein
VAVGLGGEPVQQYLDRSAADTLALCGRIDDQPTDPAALVGVLSPHDKPHNRAVSDDGKWMPLAAVVAQAQVVRGGRHEPLLVRVRGYRSDVAPVRGRHVHELDVHPGQSWR